MNRAFIIILIIHIVHHEIIEANENIKASTTMMAKEISYDHALYTQMKIFKVYSQFNAIFIHHNNGSIIKMVDKYIISPIA